MIAGMLFVIFISRPSDAIYHIGIHKLHMVYVI